jgi:hypothetical protein
VESVPELDGFNWAATIDLNCASESVCCPTVAELDDEDGATIFAQEAGSMDSSEEVIFAIPGRSDKPEPAPAPLVAHAIVSPDAESTIVGCPACEFTLDKLLGELMLLAVGPVDDKTPSL